MLPHLCNSVSFHVLIKRWYLNLISKLGLSLTNSSTSASPHSPSPKAPPDFSIFKLASESEISKILFNCRNKQCDSDPVLKECSALLVPTITNVVNQFSTSLLYLIDGCQWFLFVWPSSSFPLTLWDHGYMVQYVSGFAGTHCTYHRGMARLSWAGKLVSGYILKVGHPFQAISLNVCTEEDQYSTTKGKGKGLDTCYSATYMSQTRDQQRFTISEVAAD